MSDERAQPYDGLARWLGEEDDDPSMPRSSGGDDERPRRRHIRAVGLVAPWVITLVVLVVTSSAGGPAGDASHPPAGDRVVAAGGDGPSPERRSGPDAGAQRTPDGLGATATALVRDAITGRHGDTTRAVDVATAERPRPLGGAHWLVRVRAVVLRGDARRWRTATHEVWAVPMATRAGRVVGIDRPWRVAVERPRIATTGWSAAEVDHAAVTAALRQVDARPADDLDAEQHPDLAGIIRVRTAADGGAHVWLGTQPDLHVLGAGDRRAAERAS
jgi:hypothetical protein